MKTTFYLLILLVIITSCNSYRPTTSNSTQTTTTDTLRIANDSLEYEIIIIEPGFNTWLASQPVRGYYGQITLETRNRHYVNEYNLRVNNPIKYGSTLYQWRINYDSRVDYGYEVNYLLYNYFLFFEKHYDQKLL